MTRMTLVSMLAIACELRCVGQESREFTDCIATATTQIAMNICAAGETRRAEVELNEIYELVLFAANGQSPASVEKLKIAERAWITYRDAWVDAVYPAADKQAAYGSIFPLEANLLRAKLTRHQIELLKGLLKQYKPKR